MRRALAFVGGFSAVSTVALFGAAIWTTGDLSDRLFATGVLMVFVAISTGLPAALWGDD